MSHTAPRLLFYLALATACYIVAVWFGEGHIGFALFLIGGVIAELIFWRHLLQRIVRWWRGRRGGYPNT